MILIKENFLNTVYERKVGKVGKDMAIMRKSKISIMLSFMCLFILAGISINKTVSFLMDRPVPLNNRFTLSNIQIQLTEPSWKEANASDMYPLESIKKDPVIRNTGSVPVYAFLQVDVPVRKICLVDKNRKKTAPISTELFLFDADSKNWELIKTQNLTESIRYIYGYKKILYPQEQTATLFNTVTSVNYLEGELNPEEVYTIHIQAKAIQSQLDTEHLSMAQIYNLLPERSTKKGGILR